MGKWFLVTKSDAFTILCEFGIYLPRVSWWACYDRGFIIYWAILCPTEFVRGINLNSTLSKFHRRVLYSSKYTNLRLRIPSDIYSYDANDLSFFRSNCQYCLVPYTRMCITVPLTTPLLQGLVIIYSHNAMGCLGKFVLILCAAGSMRLYFVSSNFFSLITTIYEPRAINVYLSFDTKVYLSIQLRNEHIFASSRFASEWCGQGDFLTHLIA